MVQIGIDSLITQSGLDWLSHGYLVHAALHKCDPGCYNRDER